MKVKLERSFWVLPVLFAVALLAVAACGGDDTETGDEAPERVVALSPAFVEIFCAVDACDVLVAVDENSNFPPEVESITKLSGFDPSVEGIVASEPDLVVISFDPGGLEDALEGLGIPVLFLESPRSLACSE